MRTTYRLTLAGMLTLAAAFGQCDKAAKLTLKDATVTLAELVPAGGFTPPATGGNPERSQAFGKLPAFCRVAATLTPTPDSEIKIEVWMPAAGWNGKFQAVGNGGWSGSISYPAMARALAAGYATASTNTGHDGGRAGFVIGHPEKVTDFAWRAVHLMTVQAKEVIAANYGNGPKVSYWNGCSSGGKQALKEAQRFPNDYDGIIAGAPANNWIHQKGAIMAVAQATHKTPGSLIPKSKFAMMHQAVLDRCDALDGVKDGLIGDPTKCKFDPGVLLCKGEDNDTCLTAAQVESARFAYSPVKSPKTGEQIFPGFPPGMELQWDTLAGAEPRGVALDLYLYYVHQDPKWDWKTFDLDTDVPLADKMDNGNMAAVDPNLKEFFAHGGKLLMYHGWSDSNIMPENSVNYYKSVLAQTGEGASDKIRLFMVPGMAHCGGGEGPNTFDMMTAIAPWVENGSAPEQILASRVEKGKVVRTRPLCRYPEVAVYKGSGGIDDAANFSCKMPR